MNRLRVTGFCILLLTSIVACKPKPAEQPKAPPPEPISGELTFPPEAKPMRTEEVDLNTLLEEYITPYLTVSPFRDAEKLPRNVVAIRFNYPMVEDSQTGHPVKQAPWSFIPYRGGTYTWHDSQILTFAPNRAWESGEEIKGILPAGIKSLNGYKLLQAYQASVDYSGYVEIAGKLIDVHSITPGEPNIILLDPPGGGTIGNVAGIFIVFDQPVLIDYLKGKLKLSIKKPGDDALYQVPFTLVRKTNPVVNDIPVDDRFVVVAVPDSAFPHQSEVRLTFTAGLKGADEEVRNFKTPAPLLLEAVTCAKWTACNIREESSEGVQKVFVQDATGFLKLKFSEDLAEEASGGVEISPKPSGEKTEGIGKNLFVTWEGAPDTTYTIRFSGDFKSVHGYRTAKKLDLSVKTGHLLPAVELPVGLRTIDWGKPEALKLKWRNLSALNLKLYPVSGDGLAHHMQTFWQPPADTFFPSPSEEHPLELLFSGNPQGNRWEEASVLPDELARAADERIFYIQYETYPFVPQSPEHAKRLSALVQVTDIGLLAKRLPGGLLVHASSLATGTPLADVAVSALTLTGEVIASSETDKKGGLFFPAVSSPAVLETQLILAESGKEVAYLWMGARHVNAAFFELPVTSTSTLKDAKGKGGETRSLLFTDKGVYREGQEVHLKGLVKLPEEKKEDPPPSRVSVTIKGPTNKPVYEKEFVLKESRTFYDTWKIPETFELGKYLVVARMAGGEEAGTTGFLMADVEKASFKVDLENKKEAVKKGETWEVVIKPEYFFGLPVDRGRIKWECYQSPHPFSEAGYEDYLFHDASSPPASNYWTEAESDEVGLTQSGGNRLKIPSGDAGDYYGYTYAVPIKYNLVSTVTDEAGSSISANTSVMVHPTDFYLGLRRLVEQPRNQPLNFEWVALSPFDHQPRTGIPATASLYRLAEHWFQEEGVEESYYQESEMVKEWVAECRTVSSHERTGCSLGLNKPGRYLLRLEAEGTSGMAVVAAQEVLIAGPGVMSGAESKRHLLKVTMDREIYKPGDTAMVLFENPFTEGWATVTVEGGGVAFRESHKIGEGVSRLPVPVKAGYVPNTFVGVHIAAGRRGTVEDALGSDVASPTYLVGYTPLKVDLVDKRLDLSLTPNKSHFEPKEKVTIDLQVKENDRPAANVEIAVYAVDEAALALTNYKTPEPLKTLFPQIPLAVELADNRTRVYATDYLLSVMEKGQIMGDGGVDLEELAKSPIRQEFPDTLFWNPAVVTDAQGKARVEFTLPDSTTQIRVMAVANKGAARFGSSDAAFKVSPPLFAEPVTPPFLIRGDTADTKVRIHNTTNDPQKVAVTLVKPQVEKKEITIEPNSTAYATFNLTAPEKETGIPVEITVEGKKLKDRIVKSIPIHEDTTSRRRLAAATFSGRQTIKLKKPAEWEGADSLTLNLSAVPFTDFEQAIEYATSYPFECLEQTVSSIASLLLAEGPLADLIDNSREAKAKHELNLAAAANRLKTLKTKEGGFSNWPGEATHPFGSAYALFVMGREKDKPLSSEEIKGLKGHLKAVVEGIANNTISLSIDEQAFLLAALARTGEEPSALATRLFGEQQNLTPFGLAMTAIGLHEMDRDKEAETLVATLMARFDAQGLFLPYQPMVNLYGSETRDLAATLLALLEVSPDHPQRAALLTHLFSRQGDEGWANTQETAFALMALGRYVSRVKKTDLPPVKISLNGQPVDPKEIRQKNQVIHSLVVPFQGEATLEIESLKQLPVYVSVSSSFREKFSTDPEKRLARNLNLLASIEDRNGKPAALDALKLGELYHVRVYVKTSQDIPFFFLNYGIPAGLAPLNVELATSADTGAEPTEGEGDRRHLLRTRGRGHLTHSEVRSDRVLYFADQLPEGFYSFEFYARAAQEGKFVLPPTQAGGMYDPDIVATLPAASVQVVMP